MGRAVPIPSVETRPFWEAGTCGEFHLPRCRHCDTLLYPPPPRCPHCLGPNLRWERLSGKGALWSWTEIFINAIPGMAPPIAICEVALAEQPDLLVIASCDASDVGALRIGLDVQIYFADEGDGVRVPCLRLPRRTFSDDASGSAQRRSCRHA